MAEVIAEPMPIVGLIHLCAGRIVDLQDDLADWGNLDEITLIDRNAELGPVQADFDELRRRVEDEDLSEDDRTMAGDVIAKLGPLIEETNRRLKS